MSFQDLAITISAVNEASPVFTSIATDLSGMNGQVQASAMEMRSSFHMIGAEVMEIGSQIQASGSTITTSFESYSVEASEISAEVWGATESVKVSFQGVGDEAEAMAAKVSVSGASIREAARDFTTLGTGISAVARLGEQFGLLNKAQSEWLGTVGMSLTAIGGIVRAIQLFSSVTTIATAVQNALNISHATFLALTGVGIAVIIAAAAAMAHFASQMNSATASVKDYNAAASETPGRTRGLQRAGEEELYRRGIEH